MKLKHYESMNIAFLGKGGGVFNVHYYICIYICAKNSMYILLKKLNPIFLFLLIVIVEREREKKRFIKNDQFLWNLS